MHLVVLARLLKARSPAPSRRLAISIDSQSFHNARLPIDFESRPLVRSIYIASTSTYNYYPQCRQRRAPPLPQRRVLQPRPPMALILVCRSISPRNHVALQARLLHCVRRPILTVFDRHGQRCYHQRESMFPGALRAPHLRLRRPAANSRAKHNKEFQCFITWGI